MQEITAILLILFLPLASFLYQIFFAKKDCHKVPLISILVSLTLSISLFFQTFGIGDYFDVIDVPLENTTIFRLFGNERLVSIYMGCTRHPPLPHLM